MYNRGLSEAAAGVQYELVLLGVRVFYNLQSLEDPAVVSFWRVFAWLLYVFLEIEVEVFVSSFSGVRLFLEVQAAGRYSNIVVFLKRHNVLVGSNTTTNTAASQTRNSVRGWL